MIKPYMPCMLTFNTVPQARRVLAAQLDEYNCARTAGIKALADSGEPIETPLGAVKYLYPVLRDRFKISSLYGGVASYSAFYAYKSGKTEFEREDPVTIPAEALKMLPGFTIKLRMPFPLPTEGTIRAGLIPGIPEYIDVRGGKSGTHLIYDHGDFLLSIPMLITPKNFGKHLDRVEKKSITPKSAGGLCDVPVRSIEDRIRLYTEILNEKGRI